MALELTAIIGHPDSDQLQLRAIADRVVKAGRVPVVLNRAAQWCCDDLALEAILERIARAPGSRLDVLCGDRERPSDKVPAWLLRSWRVWIHNAGPNAPRSSLTWAEWSTTGDIKLSPYRLLWLLKTHKSGLTVRECCERMPCSEYQLRTIASQARPHIVSSLKGTIRTYSIRESYTF